MENILKQPEGRVAEWIKTTFEADNVSYAPIVLTSYPPKKRLAFELERVRYEAVITLTDFKAEVVPTK